MPSPKYKNFILFLTFSFSIHFKTHLQPSKQQIHRVFLLYFTDFSSLNRRRHHYRCFFGS